MRDNKTYGECSIHGEEGLKWERGEGPEEVESGPLHSLCYKTII